MSLLWAITVDQVTPSFFVIGFILIGLGVIIVAVV